MGTTSPTTDCLQPEIFHLGHHARQHRFRRRGAEHDQQLFLDVADEFQDTEPAQPRDAAQHDEEEQAGHIEGDHELGERSSVPMPYLPMVNAIAPKAPIGATFMMMPTMPKNACETMSMMARTGLRARPA